MNFYQLLKPWWWFGQPEIELQVKTDLYSDRYDSAQIEDTLFPGDMFQDDNFLF